MNFENLAHASTTDRSSQFKTYQRVDTHDHTTKSDGHNTTAEAIEIAVHKELEFVVVTDHDYVNREATKWLIHRGIDSCEGTEISARDYENGHSLHILFYAKHINARTDKILEDVRNARTDKIRKQCEQLSRNGFLISFPDLVAVAHTQRMAVDCLSNSHIAEYILSQPYNLERIREIIGRSINKKGEFMMLFLKDFSEFRDIGWVKVADYEPSIELVVELARENSAATSVAHPNFSYMSKDKWIDVFEKRMEGFAKKGITGIEVNPFADEKWLNAVINTAKRTDMILTFGSDSHGVADDAHRTLGELHPVATSHPEMIQKSMDDILNIIHGNPIIRQNSQLEVVA